LACRLWPAAAVRLWAAVRRPAVPGVRRAEQPSAVLFFHPDQHLFPPVRRPSGRFAPATKVLRIAWP
ncbi:MAG: hypothetical protein ABIL01_00380, partial [Pseudomonadota bacterium]